jgi:hypothetical protein
LQYGMHNHYELGSRRFVAQIFLQKPTPKVFANRLRIRQRWHQPDSHRGQTAAFSEK